ncbi:MAG: hypothetical protein M1834_000570 [Cirrosporium novae-zelandiae]|nr:MAG: hypothetical protein M1834_000570 [Cirrosporium novae-zelandiae]
MADRFPSLEEFSEGQTEPRPETSGLDGAPADEDFLARERALLGDDADLFVTPNDTATNTSATVEEAPDDDLLGGGDAGFDVPAGEPMTDFESSFPAIDTQNEQVAPGGTITGSTAPFLPGQPALGYTGYSAPEEEPQVIKEWRERRDLAIQHRDEVSATKKAETIKAAQQAIDDFYENYNNKRDKGVTQTRQEAEEFLANREDTSAGGTSWERIAKLVDLSGKGSKGGAHGTGKEKFRQLLLDLRKDEKAPGATGY